MAALTVQTNVLTGLVVSTTAAAGGGDTFVNNGKTILEVTNGAVSSVVVTVTSYAVADRPGLAASDMVGTVTSGTTKRFGPFDPRAYNSTSDGLVHVGYSAAGTVTVAAVAQA